MTEDTDRAQESYTPFELARRWQVHYQTILRRMDRGEIASFRIGDQRRVTAAEVARIESGEVPKNGEREENPD